MGIIIAIGIWLILGFIGALVNFKFDKFFRESGLTAVIQCTIVGIVGLGIGFFSWYYYRSAHPKPKNRKPLKHYTLTRTYAFMSQFVKPEGEPND